MIKPDQSVQDEKISGMIQDAADARVLSAAEVTRRFMTLESRMGVVEEEIVENTKVTTDLRDELRAGIGKDLKEMVEVFSTLRGGVKVMGWVGGLAKWMAGLGAAFAAIYDVVQNIRGIK